MAGRLTEEGRRKRFFSLRSELTSLKEKGVEKASRWVWGHGWESGYIKGYYEGQREALMAGILKMGGR